MQNHMHFEYFFSKKASQYANISYVKSVDTEHLKQEARLCNVPESELNLQGWFKQSALLLCSRLIPLKLLVPTNHETSLMKNT